MQTGHRVLLPAQELEFPHTTITIPPSNEVDQADSTLLVAFPAATETVASANGAIMVVAERRDEVAEPSH